jgi:hypothetical protein
MRAAGETTMTSGLSSADTSELDNVAPVLSSGKSVRSSNCGMPVLTIAGMGTKEKTSTAAAVARRPLMMSSVDRKEDMAARTRGGWVRNATFRMAAKMHSTGSSGTSSARPMRAHRGIGWGGRLKTAAGASGSGTTLSISSTLTTTFSDGMSAENPWVRG